MTQTYDGEESPATEVTVTHKEGEKLHHFKTGYWEPYGLVINGQVEVEGVSMPTSSSSVKTFNLVNAENQVVSEIPTVNTNWYNTQQYDGYQAILSENAIAGIQSGEYKLEIRVSLNQGETVTVPFSLTESQLFGIQDYRDAFLDIPTNIIGTRKIETISKDGQATLRISNAVEPVMGLISEAQIKEGRVVNGYILNTEFDFNQAHKKNVVIEDKSGKEVKILENIHTWDLTDWCLEINNLQMKSGFQLIIPSEYQNASLYQYKLQVITDSAEKPELEVMLDKVI
ncbi:hypothetical protein A5814_002772 [Enterococcus faecium]|nr:hypothetical protein A5814_002772 [Enterococcus faecium]